MMVLICRLIMFDSADMIYDTEVDVAMKVAVELG